MNKREDFEEDKALMLVLSIFLATMGIALLLGAFAAFTAGGMKGVRTFISTQEVQRVIKEQKQDRLRKENR